jgi:aerobic-type carbon monoxide dehydrogenase small subunit (CoxS/CutS family)
VTDDQHGEGAPQGGGRWNRLPQGDYDDGATAFVKLPEGGIDALLSGDSPLAAPGHGYVPPRIAATQAEEAPAAWPAPDGGGQWPDPDAAQAQAQPADDRFTYQPGATQHWTFEEQAAPAASAHDVTGQWSIPVAGGELPDESGEFTTSSLVEQWGGTPPATLPGGAPAPWATDGAGRPWDQPAAPQPGHTGADAFAPQEPYGQEPSGRTPTQNPGAGPSEAGRAEAARRNAPGAGAQADAHRPAEAPERPADAAADHEEPTHRTGAPQAATRPGAPATSGPQATADAAGAEAHGEASETAVAEHGADAAADDTPEGPAPDRAAAGEDGDGADDTDAALLPPNDDHPLASYVLRVNGADRPVTDAWIGESLLYVLRERLGLAGAKDGCSQGECGACNVQVDGRLVASCLVPAVTAAGSEVRTVEGLAADGQPSDVQRALARCGAVQCGFCVPGMAMTVHDLLEGNPAPTELETRQALCGNLCRCSGYRGVLQAVQEVVAEREASHADPEADGDEARIPRQAGPGAGGVNPSAFEAPGAFDTPQAPRGDYGTAPDPYAAPDPYGTPPHGTPGPHDQHYGQDGGQA